MQKNILNKMVTIAIGLIWLVNGLLCKVLNLVPRHKQIVSLILGEDFAKPLTISIGVLEIFMAGWIVSGYKSRVNAILQMLIIGVMNILEFTLVPDLLLWGKYNIVFAFLLICVIFYNEFYLKKTN
ncbi:MULTISPECIES: DoxX-like family protein [unclassified Cellulophaga]|uniref:DoxX-like family protein n=1 Tax=unclassified Cellulophaga TaxID=2634405 RepID=UPI0026E38E4F|nr:MULTISPECIES: DoxX-like family protein [unclassified Cellulophaga]MDO6490509.1 DoxX-like family protein [Cellulophaga sp. 2_MG-2023]MDO6494297.1 DoxX-like family protein [Cellulophaga sp. 3_MG-2023]